MEIRTPIDGFPARDTPLFVQFDEKKDGYPLALTAAFEVLSGRPKTPVR